MMVRRVLFSLGLVLVLVALLPALVVRAGTPFDNGTFDTDLSSWSVGGLTPSNCLWDGSTGYPDAGSALIGTMDSCYITPAGETWMSSYSMEVEFDFHNPSDAGLMILVSVGEGYPVWWHVPACEVWCSGSTGWFNVPGGNTVHVYFQNDGMVSANVDTVSYDLGDPGLSATPTSALPTGTPTNPHVSATQAAGQVTVSAGTPFYDSGSSFGPMPYLPTGDSDLTHAVRIESVQAPWSFCLPSAVSSIFTGVNLCLTIPVISFVHFVFLGVDLMPGLTLTSAVLLIAFVVRQIQER